jgi:hypothetical protein
MKGLLPHHAILELAAAVRFGAYGLLCLMPSLTTTPTQRRDETQIYQRPNATGKKEVVVKRSTGDPVILATEAWVRPESAVRLSLYVPYRGGRHPC